MVEKEHLSSESQSQPRRLGLVRRLWRSVRGDAFSPSPLGLEECVDDLSPQADGPPKQRTDITRTHRRLSVIWQGALLGAFIGGLVGGVPPVGGHEIGGWGVLYPMCVCGGLGTVLGSLIGLIVGVLVLEFA